MDISSLLNQANGRLKAGRIQVSIKQKRNSLCLKATFPPKPQSGKTVPYQQELYPGLRANPAGVKAAERLAREVSVALMNRRFCWEDYVHDRTQPMLVRDWLPLFEQDYFSKRERNPKTETTWDKDYRLTFLKLPQEEPLTAEAIRKTVLRTEPDTKARKRYTMALGALARLAGIEVNLSGLAGKYNPRRVEPRDIPPDDLILDWYYRIPIPAWQWFYGVIATYGLRPHEAMHLTLSGPLVAQVPIGTKTGARQVWPFHKHWVEEFSLTQIQRPNITGKNNMELGTRSAQYFKRLGLPFQLYNLRHAWSVRTLELGVPITLAAQQQGHSVKTHSDLYHHWIGADVHQRAFEKIYPS